jgi:hypothetical protein
MAFAIIIEEICALGDSRPANFKCNRRGLGGHHGPVPDFSVAFPRRSTTAATAGSCRWAGGFTLWPERYGYFIVIKVRTVDGNAKVLAPQFPGRAGVDRAEPGALDECYHRG